MPQISHAYAVGRVRALERTLIKQDTLDKMCAAATVQEAARMLADSGWGDAQDQSGVERLVEQHVAEACALLRECTAEPAVTDCFLIKYDIVNLKALIKARLLGETAPKLSPNGLMDAEKLRHAVTEALYKDLAPEFRDALDEIEEKSAVEQDPMWIDARLDRLMFAEINRRLKAVKNCPEAICKYFAAKADAANVLTALRVRAMGRDADFAMKLYVDGGCIAADALNKAIEDPESLAKLTETGEYGEYIRRGLNASDRGEGLSPMEKEFEDYQTALFRTHRYEVDTILPLVGYWLAREREAGAVRLIITAKAVGAGETALRLRLRMLYA